MVAKSHLSSPSAPSGGDGAAPRPPPKRRKRAVISCVECHRRKQKCDRELPCSNCKFRNKESACRYESTTSRPASHDPARPIRFDPPRDPAEAPYARRSTESPLAATAQKLNNTHLGAAAQVSPQQPLDAEALRKRYKDLVRQLPTGPLVDHLVEVYFRDINWQYYTLDHGDFLRRLSEWRRAPLHVFSTAGPAALPHEMRAFPALLFMVFANALVAVADEAGGPFDALKYTGAMTLQDLAGDYCESAEAVLALLGRGDVSITSVQAGLLRAMFFKTCLRIVDAWHALRSTIADAQEMGLHDDARDPKPMGADFPTIFENEWLIQRRRILFMTLMSWDIHYASILGRPTFIDRRLGTPSIPIDAPVPKDKSTTPVRRRDENTDPPTPLTRALWLYRASALLWEARELHEQAEGPSRVEKLHARIMEFIKSVPSYLRLDNPDWRWDSHPDCSWLVSSRFYLAQLSQLAVMVLHRPYVFASARSRTEALRAAVDLLAYQRMTFQGAELNSRKNVALFFGSLDAMVLIAYTYIFFPRENRDTLQDAAQQFEWTTVRFDAMRRSNPAAQSAKSVAEAIYRKMRRAVESSPAPTDPLSIASICTTPTPAPDSPSPLSGPAASISGVVQGDVPGLPGSPGVDVKGIGPVHPVWDILFHSLRGEIPDAGGSWTGKESGRFTGDFGQRSLWGILNQLP